MLRDQLIANGLLAAVKDDLLLEEDVMLEKAVTIVCQVEAAVRNLSLFCNPTTTMKSVQAVSVTSKYGKSGRSAHMT